MSIVVHINKFSEASEFFAIFLLTNLIIYFLFFQGKNVIANLIKDKPTQFKSSNDPLQPIF